MKGVEDPDTKITKGACGSVCLCFSFPTVVPGTFSKTSLVPSTLSVEPAFLSTILVYLICVGICTKWHFDGQSLGRGSRCILCCFSAHLPPSPCAGSLGLLPAALSYHVTLTPCDIWLETVLSSLALRTRRRDLQSNSVAGLYNVNLGALGREIISWPPCDPWSRENWTSVFKDKWERAFAEVKTKSFGGINVLS